ncbi:rab11 family-interacting protein 1 [Rhea pennata]|uniref:rab11 family-interacting protein 1 n=1 Tax=Rhea pennata TaxID=8795 RepID=UPI002E275B2F
MEAAGAAARWAPTHVQVTVLQARGLRAKAAAGGGGSDAYAVMALGGEKFSTSVAERCQGRPVWREEAAFELPPPPRPAALRLTVLHRALVGLDKFLGRAEVDLAALRADGARRHSRWYKLHSKPGKKEKERGEIEVDIQFMRSNMTASMFDLSMKDKSRSAFGKLKDKLKGKRSSGLSDTASAIIPSTSHSPADSEDESVEKEKKKSKFKTLFSKPGLQKTSISQSMSVLPTHQPVTEKVRLRPSDFQSRWDDDDESETSPTSDKGFRNTLEEKSSPSPVSKFHKIANLDSRQLNQINISNTKKEGLSLFGGLKSKSDPISKSSLCINGSHVYMEENMPKDNTPASSPSPHNFRKKQLFTSEENLSSKFAKGPEETGRTSPSGILSGSASLDTFKSMTLPSYKLLSSEDYMETNVPLTVDITKENKKIDHKKSALFSLVTGRKETVKNNDVESIPDRSLKEEESKVSEEKSEEETKHLEIPADLSKGNPFENSNEEETFKNKQPLNPFEEDRKPEKAAASAKTTQTKAVKPRLGVSSEEETKATLPIFAPDSPPFLSVHHISSDNNPFISKTRQKVEVPDSENIASFSAPLPPSLPSAAKLLNSKNPFISTWDKESKALDSESIANFSLSHHLAASVPETFLSVQISSNDNNPFTSKWGQGSQGQDFESSSACPSLDHSGPSEPCHHSDCHFNESNPFVCKPGFELDAPGLKTVAGSSPFLIPCEEDCSSIGNTGNLKHSLHMASGSSSNVAITSNLNTVSNSPDTLSDNPDLASKKQCDSPKVQVETSLKRSQLSDRKPVTFLSEELEGITSGDEDLDEQQCAKQPSDFCEMLFTDLDVTGERAEFAHKLERECNPSSKLPSDSVISTQSKEITVQGDVEIGSTSTETCMKDAEHFASLSQCNDNLLPENDAEQLSSAKSKLKENQEIFSEKRTEECKLMLEIEAIPSDKNNSLSQVGPTKPTFRVCTLPFQEADAGRADSEASSVFVTPKPAPPLSLLLKTCMPVSQTGELSGAVLSSDDDVKSASGLPLRNEKPSSAYEYPYRNDSLKTVTPTINLRDDSSNRHLKYEDDDLFDTLANLKSAIPVAGDHGLTLASLPVILEGGSDDELLEDCQEDHNVTADDKNTLEAGKHAIDIMPLSEELKEHSDNNSPANSVPLSAQEGGSVPDACNSSKLPVLPARVRVCSVNNKIADLNVGVTSHSSECNSHFERQELKIETGVEESAERDFLEPSASSFSVSSSSQPYSSFHSHPSHTQSTRAESSKKPTAEGFADKAENSGKKKLLQAWISPSETYPNQTQQSGETMSSKHRLQPVKPMNATASKSQTKNMNVISTMNEKLLEMSIKKYDPSDPGYAYAQLTYDELIQLVLKQKDTIIKKEHQVRELEDYIDNLLVRVMEETPNILRVSTSGNKKAGKI